MKISSLFNSQLNEDYEQYKNSRWVHYTDFEMLKIRLGTNQENNIFHHDPAGLYFFPENDPPKYDVWYEKTYRFVIGLKPTARVLDLPRMSETDLKKMVDEGGATKQFEDSIDRHPPKSRKDLIKRAWESLANQAATTRRFNIKWNAILRHMGYDAVFDDAGIIHAAEPIQLLVLNPAVMNVLERQPQKKSMFHAMQQVLKDMITLLEPYGKVAIDPPKRRTAPFSSEHILRASISVDRSETNYAHFSILSDRSDLRPKSNKIRVSLNFSRPRLDYGVGATFDTATDQWEKYSDLTRLKIDLDRIFSSDETPL